MKITTNGQRNGAPPTGPSTSSASPPSWRACIRRPSASTSRRDSSARIERAGTPGGTRRPTSLGSGGPAADAGRREPRRGQAHHGHGGGPSADARADRAARGSPAGAGDPDAREPHRHGHRAARERLRAAVARRTCVTRHVSLRPLQAGDPESLWAARMRSDEPWADSSDAARRKLRDRVANSGRVPHGELLLDRGGRPPRRRDPGSAARDGSAAGRVRDRHRGLRSDGAGDGDRTRALGLFLVHLFVEEHAHRVQLTTDVDNAAMRRVSEHLGVRAEGTLRGFMPTKNGPRDYVMYGITRDDFDEARKVWNSTG